MTPNKKALLAPLYWGYGHAARLMAYRHRLKKENYDIVWLIDGALIEFVYKDCPEDLFIENFEHQFRYGTNALSTMLQILRQTNAFFSQIKKDKKLIAQLHQEHHFDLIVSDNRYGAYHEKVKSILITHQLSIRAGIFTGIVQRTNLKWLNSFDEIHVPDFETREKSLAGNLSHPEKQLPENLQKKLKYIGALSRFGAAKPNQSKSVLVLLSGPEPQRSILEKILLEALRDSSKKIIFVRGTQQEFPEPQKNIFFQPFIETRQLKTLLDEAGFVIARGGYSTLMDLYCSGKKALMIPTPGQLEQEYLAQWNNGKHDFTFVNQNKSEIQEAIAKLL